MNTLARIARLLGALLLGSLFAGCASGAGASFGTPSVIDRITPGDRFDKSDGTYQFVSNYYDDTLLKFDYPKGIASIGQITGGYSAGGMCGDVLYGAAKKYFWVAEGAADAVYEYSYKGGSPIKELGVTAGGASDCAMDPRTGNLAVTIAEAGEVVIFKNAGGSGRTIGISGAALTGSDGYDDHGNLFVIGRTTSGKTFFAELPIGSDRFEMLLLNKGMPGDGGSVQYDGKYIALSSSTGIYGYACHDATCVLKRTVELSGGGDLVANWIGKGVIFCPDAGNDDVAVYKYPAGGSPIATLTGNFDLPMSVVEVSK